MNVHLTFQDLARLAANSEVEKDGVTITVDALPLQRKIKVDPTKGNDGYVVFWMGRKNRSSSPNAPRAGSLPAPALET